MKALREHKAGGGSSTALTAEEKAALGKLAEKETWVMGPGLLSADGLGQKPSLQLFLQQHRAEHQLCAQETHAR